MKRIRIVGLCVVAVLAMAAVAASAAQAAPEYFVCGKASKAGKEYTGKYSAKGCSNSSKVETGGKYERVSAVGTTLSSKSKTAVLSTPDIGGKVTCKKSAGSGTVTSATTSAQVVTFEDCETLGKKCNSAGESAGKIKTNNLLVTVVGETELKFTSTSGAEGYQAEFECEGLLVRTKGYTVGHVTSPAPGTGSKKSTVKFAGEENLLTEVNIGEGFIGPFPSEENVEASVKNSAELGIS
jgi:hypothetical protein